MKLSYLARSVRLAAAPITALGVLLATVNGLAGPVLTITQLYFP